MSNSKNPIGVIGAGTMGAGIAQVAAMHGWSVRLVDVDKGTTTAAIEGIRKRLDRQVAKDIVSKAQREEALARITPSTDSAELAGCDLVIEAVVEDLAVKTMVLQRAMKALGPDAVIATNTSSLSVAEIGEATGDASRVVGMHFFNPAPLMPLVEVVSGPKTRARAARRVTLIAEAWGKTVVQCKDTPGFIVNRVARPFYLEAFRILEDGYANVEEIDGAMRHMGGFRMGPFELTDLIGHDINLTTTTMVWKRLGEPTRLRPSRTQTKLVNEGHMGRKSGRGMYSYASDPPTVAVALPERANTKDAAVRDAVKRFATAGADGMGSEPGPYVFARILGAVINEAMWTMEEGVAGAEDINIGMKMGTNYPKGPIEWANEIGLGVCAQLLDALNATVSDGRFAMPEGMRKMAGQLSK